MPRTQQEVLSCVLPQVSPKELHDLLDNISDEELAEMFEVAPRSDEEVERAAHVVEQAVAKAKAQLNR